MRNRSIGALVATLMLCQTVAHATSGTASSELSPAERLALLGNKHKAAALAASRGRGDSARGSLELLGAGLQELAAETVGPDKQLPLVGWDDALSASIGYAALARRHLDQGDPQKARDALDRMALVWARLRAQNHVSHWFDSLTFYQEVAAQVVARAGAPARLPALLPSLRYRLAALEACSPPMLPKARPLYQRELAAVATSVAALEHAVHEGDAAQIQAAALALREPLDTLYADFR